MHPQVVYYNSDVSFQSSGHLVAIILGINFVLMRTRVKKPSKTQFLFREKFNFCSMKNSIFIQSCDSSFTSSTFPDYIKSIEQDEGVETVKKDPQTKPTKPIKLNN